jgi:hypothetical protein
MGKPGNLPPYRGRGTGGLHSIRLLQSSFHGVGKRSERVIVMNDEDELMAQQSKNESLLISSFDTSRNADKARN